MARDAIQSQLEATEARIYTMDQHITERLDRMTVQVVQLNELKGLARQILQALDRQLEAINNQTAAINGQLQVAQQQSANITELSKLVATQAATVDFLIRRTSA